MRTRLLMKAFIEMMKDTYTQIPGYVASFDPATQLAQLQIGVLANEKKPDIIIECPVHFSGDDEWSIEHQINAGCEGMIFFSQRCVDGWLETGGVANNPIARFHDKQDAFFLPGFRSKPNVISDFANDGIRLRNKSASVYHWLKSDGTIESKNTTGSVTISNGSMNLQSTGDITINDSVFSPSGIVEIPTSVATPLAEAVEVVSTTVASSSSITKAGVEVADLNHTHSVVGVSEGDETIQTSGAS